MAREQVSNLEREHNAPTISDAQLHQMGNGPRGNGDRFKAKTPIVKSKEFTHG
jgi:hypothetical protein